jgi:hypothetical protein
VKAAVIVVCGAIAVLAFTGRLSFGAGSGSGSDPNPDPSRALDGVSEILASAVEAGQPARPGTPAGKLNAQCALRERRLTALRRPASPGLRSVRAHALRVLQVLQAHSRAASEPAEVRALDVEQQRTIQRLAHAAGRGDYRAAQAEGMALRELAGRANVTFMRLRLTNCLMRPSAIPY